MGEVPIRVDPDAEGYPVVAIYEQAGSSIKVPAEMMTRLAEAKSALSLAELDIMRYVAEHYHAPMVREWLAEHDDSGEIDGE